MSVFSQAFRKTAKKVMAWSLSAMTALTCATTLPLLTTSTTVHAAEAYTVDLKNEQRGVLYANSRSDFRDESIYFLITTRFYDGDPSNNAHCVDDTKAKNPDSDPAWRGDFAGLIDKLDYIKALGFTAIWITPVVQNRSSYDYHGYHAYDFTAVDTRYESNGITYQDLIDACHAKGMKIIQDVVFNHSCNWGEKNLCPIEIDVWAPNGRSDMVMGNERGISMDPDKIYHHAGYAGSGDYDNFNVQPTTLHSDCFDLNTENPTVYNYLIDCYKKFIDMGVDAFRVDTVKHIARLTLNKTFIPALQAEYKKVHSGSGYDNFYMFGEVCTKGESTWYRDNPPISTCFYTWKDDDSWLSRWTTDPDANLALTEEHYNAHLSIASQPTSDNAFLKGNDYHTPDYSQHSGLDVIDFQMHWQFDNAGQAFGMAKAEDPYFNDSTWNVTYVNSHDYSPNTLQTIIPDFSEETWAEDLNLIFTFRGIPCIYYGTEIRFQHGKVIDKGPDCPLSETGRAYFGDNIEGSLTVSDFGVFDASSGSVKETLESPLAQHLIRLNRLRQSIPALRKGQYSTEGISGSGMAFKRRYTDANVDSFCCVTISGGATFSGVPNGTYIDAVTGDTQNVTGGTLTANCSGQGNLRVYVLSTSKTPAPGRVVPNGSFMGDGGAAVIINHESSNVNIVKPTGITVNPTTVSVLEGESSKVTATVAPSDATDKSVSWSSSDTSVATVVNGNITGVAAGTATITAKTSNNLTATVKVTVKTNPNIVKPTGITITPSSLTLTAGETGSLTATVTPSNATDKTVTWSSSAPSVAKVSNGTITAVSAGTTTITAATSNGLKATATVTVEGKTVKYIENGVYFEKPSGWGSTINAYIYDSTTDSPVGAGWPGTKMTQGSDNVYYYEYTASSSTLKIIFNDGNNQVPGSQQPGFDYKNRGYYTTSGLDHIVEQQTTVDVTSVSLNKTSASVAVGGTVTLTATVAPSNATNKTITWSSSNPSVASVNNGVVTALSAGTTTIKATSNNGKTATATVTVTASNVTNLKNTSALATASVVVNNKATINCSASGGTSPYQYAVYQKKSTESSYTLVKSLNTTKTATFTPSTTGTYNIRTKVKDNDGTWAVKDLTLTVTKEGNTSLANKTTVSSTSISPGDSVTVTGAASGGTSPYQYVFYYKKSGASSYTSFKSLNTTKTATLKLNESGTYNIRTKVKDNAGTWAVKDVNVTVSQQVLTNTSKISASSASLGQTITITASATGGTAPYQYAAFYKKSSASSFTTIQNYGSNKVMTLDPTSSGTYTVRVKVMDNKGTSVLKDFDLTIKNTGLANMTKLSADSVALGSSVKVNGSALSGSSPYQYAFYYKKSTADSFTQLKALNSTATATFKPSATGTYTIRTKVKDNAGTWAVKDLTLKVTPGPLANKTTVSATSVVRGTKVTFTGAATGGTAPYSYVGYYKKSTESEYCCFRAMDTATSMSFVPAETGTYNVRIKVKDKAGTFSVKDFNITVTATSFVNKTTISATSIPKGNSVKITGAAANGAGSYQYVFYYKLSSESSFTQLKALNTTATATFKPTHSGTFTIRSKVKDKNGNWAVKDLTLKVLVNTTTISATSIKKGSSVKITGSAAGGTTPYQYVFYVKKSTEDSFTQLKALNTTATATYKPATTGTYTIRTKVKDKDGTFAVKDLTLKVTA